MMLYVLAGRVTPKKCYYGGCWISNWENRGEKKKTMTLKWFSGRLGREKSDCQSHSGGHSKYMDKNISTSHAFILHLNYVIFEVFLADEHWTAGPKIMAAITMVLSQEVGSFLIIHEKKNLGNHSCGIR